MERERLWGPAGNQGSSTALQVLTFRVLPRRRSLDAERLPGSAAVSEAPALGHFARAVLDALVSAGGPPDALSLWRAFPFGASTAGTGEDTIFQTDLLTVQRNTLKQRQKGDSRRSHSGNHAVLPHQPLETKSTSKQQ